MIRITKKIGESSDRVIQRFNKKIQQSRILHQIRDKRYFTKKKTKRKIRAAALMREYYRALREKRKYYGE